MRRGLHGSTHPGSLGMGATVVALVFDSRRLWWISVGNSPLYLYRDGVLRQLNEDHSLAPQIDYLVANGMMDPETGRNHPDRHCLTSVLIGREIDRIDCVEAPFPLQAGDVVIVASDGLQALSETEIAEHLAGLIDAPAERIATTLMDAVEACGDPDLDNVSLSVIRPLGLTAPVDAAAPGRGTVAADAAAPGTGLSAVAPMRWLRGGGCAYLFRRKATGKESTS